MGDPAYEARRTAEAERRASDKREAEEYQQRKELGDEVSMLVIESVKAFLQGNAALWVEQIADSGSYTVRFHRDPSVTP